MKKILPIAIDLGAKNTGVFSAYYDKDTKLENLKHKQGNVYDLSKDAYTLLMTSRTTKRHQRRGLDRKQLVKRLFKLIWEQHFNLSWDDDIQQTTSFLLNRRGFSFLGEKHDVDILARVPKEVVENLPKLLQPAVDDMVLQDNKTYYDLNNKLEELSKDNDDLVKSIESIKKNILLVKLCGVCKLFLEKGDFSKLQKEKQDLSEIDKSCFELIKEYLVKIDSLNQDKYEYINKDGELKQSAYFWNEKYNLLKFIENKYNENDLKIIIDNIEYLNLDENIWKFNPNGDFVVENKSFSIDEEKKVSLEEAKTNKQHEKARGDIQKQEIEVSRNHLHHLCFALYNIKKELESGSRYRSKYFEEVALVLLTTEHQETYLKNFCQNLHNDKYTSVSVKKLTNLIGNISNLELKPLRKYFNDIEHAKADYWDENRFAKTFNKWILGEWRVGSKDKDKKLDGKYSYRNLCDDIKANVGTSTDIKASIVNYLTTLDPCRTIPPYQDNNNRKPPKCQSLVLNTTFLNNKYPQWQIFLKTISDVDSVSLYLNDFSEDLSNLATGKGGKYFVATKSNNRQIASGQRDYHDLDARVLQYILDRVKANDDLNLNEIYSYTKKIRQNNNNLDLIKDFQNKLYESIKSSKLPENLKIQPDYSSVDIFNQGTFLHLICRYYRLRQRARDSRIYIMPEYKYDRKEDKYIDSGRYDSDNHLLTFCNHKPRQKIYQLFNDLAGVLQVAPSLLLEKANELSNDKYMTEEAVISEWLKNFKIGSYCKKAVEMQKLHRGTLKLILNKALFKVKIEKIKNDKKATEDDRNLVEYYKNVKKITAEEKELVNLHNNIQKASQKIADNLGLEASETVKFNSVYSFAQIQQIAFVERSGNANTCAVCSVDNAHRMKMTADIANAQRLPSIPTRVIDGAVKKVATILSKNIVDDNWDNVKQALQNATNISIPIITESNSFEFEPNLAELKGTKKKESKDKKALFEVKENRIQKASLKICAYTGESTDSDTELDHIVPRSSRYGVLNDEANLICVSRVGNQEKGNKIYYLTNLAVNYKLEQFGTVNDAQIENFIKITLWDDENQKFKFGNYRSFINLSDNEQKAFRHALFLNNENPLKKEVIKALNNRNRTFVNGTQRYFAQVLANAFYLRAKRENLDTSKLSFDYFGVETTNSRGNGISDVRKFYEFIDDDITAYAKGDKPQDAYSHLIDAMLAFCVATNEHKNEGSIGLEITDDYSLVPFDIDTGEVLKDIFTQIKVSDDEFKNTSLARRKATDGFNTHRQMTRDGIYAEKYLPILIHKNLDEVRKGFSWENSEEIKIIKGKKNDLNQLGNILYSLRFIDNAITIDTTVESLTEIRAILEQNNISSTTEYFYINLKVQKLHKFYVENYNTALGYQKYTKEMVFLRGLAYRTEKKRITSIDDVTAILAKDSNFKVGKVYLPYMQEWQNLYDSWIDLNNKEDNNFLKNYFNVSNNTKHHYKIRKDFSLPISSAQGKFLVKRKTWDNQYIYQILNDSESRTDGGKPFIPAFDLEKNQIIEVMVSSFISRNIFWLPKNLNIVKVDNKSILAIDTSAWFSIEMQKCLGDLKIKKLEYKIDNNTRPKVKVTLFEQLVEEDINVFVSNVFLKPRYLDKLTELLKSNELTFEYHSNGFNKDIYKSLAEILANHNQ